MENRRGFSLIELLVVLGVITLLIAIMVPSLSRSRKLARSVVCETNQRELVSALRNYVAEWNTTITTAGKTGQAGQGGHAAIYGAWDYQILGANVTQSVYYANNARRDAADRLRWCPETSRPRRAGPAVGTASVPWDCRAGSYGGSTGSYGFNNWLYRPDHFRPKSGTVSQNDFHRIKSTQNDSIVPVFADAVWHDFLPRISDVPAVNLQDPEGSSSADRTLADTCIDRHSRAVNVSFLDGHVESVKLANLWTLKWSANWNRTTPMKVN